MKAAVSLSCRLHTLSERDAPPHCWQALASSVQSLPGDKATFTIPASTQPPRGCCTDLVPRLCRPQALMLLCDFILNSMLHPPGEQIIYHTLLQLCLVERLSDEELAGDAVQASQAQRRRAQSVHGT